MPLSKPDQRAIRGKLEVRAVVNTRMGLSEDHVPVGTIGYVTYTAHGKWVVFWPSIPRRYKGDWRTAVHTLTDLEPTGKRG